jgi:hypothetical protein
MPTTLSLKPSETPCLVFHRLILNKIVTCALEVLCLLFQGVFNSHLPPQRSILETRAWLNFQGHLGWRELIMFNACAPVERDLLQPAPPKPKWSA